MLARRGLIRLVSFSMEALNTAVKPTKITLTVDGVLKNGNTKDAQKWLAKWGVEESLLLKVKKAHRRAVMVLHVPDATAAAQVKLLLQGKDSGKGRLMNVTEKDPDAGVAGSAAAYESQRKRIKKEDIKGEVIHDVRDVVTPLWKVSAEEQINRKNASLQSVFKQMFNKTRRESKGKTVPPWALTNVEPMALIEGGQHRNKLSFTIGNNAEGKVCIGFRVGRTEQGSTATADPSEVSFCDPRTLAVRAAMQNLLEQPDALLAKDNISHMGFWRQLEVRTNVAGESLAVVQVDETGVSSERVASERAALEQAMRAVPGVLGLGWQHNGTFSQGSGAQVGPVEFLFGDGVLEEKLGDLTFRIPPRAFFQTNSVRVVGLYDMAVRMVRDEAARLTARFPGRSVKVYDVCCGIGTIGIYLRRHLGASVGEVVGIDIEPTGIEAAEENARLNKIEGLSFIASAAEKVLPGKLKAVHDETIIAVVDPPRAGLHPDVLRALRNCLSVQSVVYISCNTKSLVQDTVPLCKPSTKRYDHAPFEPVWMSGVDMFPNTEHSEACVTFCRKEEEIVSGPDAMVDDDEAKTNVVAEAAQ